MKKYFTYLSELLYFGNMIKLYQEHSSFSSSEINLYKCIILDHKRESLNLLKQNTSPQTFSSSNRIECTLAIHFIWYHVRPCIWVQIIIHRRFWNRVDSPEWQAKGRAPWMKEYLGKMEQNNHRVLTASSMTG